jgi:HAD superfamily hydrolase (TIGR01509 family)
MSPRPSLLFDLDGTLVDTDRIHFKAFNVMLEPFGRSITQEEYKTQIMGFPNVTIMPRVLPGVSATEQERLAARKEEIFRELADELEPIDGLIDLLDWAAGHAVPVAVVTNAPRANAEMVLRALKLDGRFDAVVIADDLPHQKPHPLPYLTGLERLGSAAGHAVAFEDSRSGVMAAAAAGLPVVGIRTSLDDATLVAAGAAMTADHFAEPAVRELIAARTGFA